MCICAEREKDAYRNFAALYKTLPSSGKLALQAWLDVLERHFMGLLVVK